MLKTFEQLDPDQWEMPSLCGEWTMREMLAHLTLAARPPKRRFVAAIARARGSFDRANHELAVADGQRDIVDGNDVAVGLDQISQDHLGHQDPFRSCRWNVPPTGLTT